MCDTEGFCNVSIILLCEIGFQKIMLDFQT